MRRFLQKVQEEPVRKALVYSVLDGVLWAIMYGFADSYLVPFARLFKASAFQLSLIQGVALLGSCLAQLAGARLIMHFKQRKIITLVAVRTQAIGWLLILGFALWTRNIWGIIGIYFIQLLSANLGSPGWLSWMNDLIPKTFRGEYWGLRNRAIGIVQVTAMITAGLFLQLAKTFHFEHLAFGVLFVLAFASRFTGSFMLQKQHEPPMHIDEKADDEMRLTALLPKLFTTNFGRFTVFRVLMAFAANVLTPVLSVFLLESLHYNYVQFTVLMMASTVASFFSMTYWGPLSDRYGNYRVIAVTAVMVPLFAFGWGLFKNFYVQLLMQLFAGFVWSGFDLAVMNYIFDTIPREHVAKISAYLNMFANLFAFAGTVLAGLLTKLTPQIPVHFWASGNYEIIFFLSGLLRLLVIGMFLKEFREVRQVEPSPAIHHFYIYRPMRHVVNAIQVLNDKWFGEDEDVPLP